jgi:predicted transcriptional regulator of viral defense system
MASRSAAAIEAPPRRLDQLVDALQSHGRYTFERDEALRSLGTTGENLKKAVQLLIRRRRLASPRRGFYVIVPTEYRVSGSPPASWYVHDLMKAIGAPYYVGVLTAAALHGAAHQAPQEFQVVTPLKPRLVPVGRDRIRFLRKRRIGTTRVMAMKTPTGTMRVSTPEATALDLLRYVERAGFLLNVATVLKELAPLCDPAKLIEVVDAEGALPHVQRLGYLFDVVGSQELSEPLARWVADRRPDWVRLQSGQSARRARRERRWRLVVNTRVEPDA